MIGTGRLPKPSICTLCPAGCGLLVRVMQGEAEVVRNGKLGLIKMGLAKKLEGNADAAEALKLWATQEPVGNHTYSHMDLETNPVEAFEREIEENEPALELLAATDNWHWLRYPYLHEGDTVEERRAVRAYLKARGYSIAQVSLDWEDYLWNTAYARCVAKYDTKAIAWLRSSYLSTASEFLDLGRAQRS